MNFLKVLYVFQAFAHYTSGKQAYFNTSQSGDVWQQDKPNFRSLHQCRLKSDCSDIAIDKKSGKLMQVKGKEEKDKALKDGKMIWTKIPLIGEQGKATNRLMTMRVPCTLPWVLEALVPRVGRPLRKCIK